MTDAVWIPGPGDLVADTARDVIGTAVAWDGKRREVTMKPLPDGDLWRTTHYRKPTNIDRMRARVVMLTRERRGW